MKPLLYILLMLASGFVAAQQPAPAPSNPLLYRFNQPVNFANVKTEHIRPATEAVVANVKSQLAKIYAIPDDKRTFDNTMRALDEAYNQLIPWGSIAVLSRNSPATAVRDEAAKGEELLTKLETEIALDETLYKALKAYSRTKEARTLTGFKKRFLEKTIWNFERKGFALSADKRNE